MISQMKLHPGKPTVTKVIEVNQESFEFLKKIGKVIPDTPDEVRVYGSDRENDYQATFKRIE